MGMGGGKRRGDGGENGERGQADYVIRDAVCRYVHYSTVQVCIYCTSGRRQAESVRWCYLLKVITCSVCWCSAGVIAEEGDHVFHPHVQTHSCTLSNIR